MGGPRTVLRFCARTVRASKAVTQFSFTEPKLYQSKSSHLTLVEQLPRPKCILKFLSSTEDVTGGEGWELPRTFMDLPLSAVLFSPQPLGEVASL